jgi:hypothetical protein
VGLRRAHVSLTEGEVLEAMHFRLYLLAERLLVQHPQTGPEYYDPGRLFLLLRSSDSIGDEVAPFVCQCAREVIRIGHPRAHDVERNLPPGIAELKTFFGTRTAQPPRLMFCPLGEERAWLHAARESAKLPQYPTRIRHLVR